MKLVRVLVARVGVYAFAVLAVAGVIGYVQPDGDVALTTTEPGSTIWPSTKGMDSM